MRDGLPEPGDVIAQKYEVTALLGRGGMGSVYAVTHRLTGHRMAIKCLLPRVAENPVHVERFLREARAVGRIHHRNVIEVLDVGADGPLRFIVLPLLTGKLLSTLYDERALSPERVVGIMLRVMRGVAAAHAAGIIHRDLKPANVFVCEGHDGELGEPRVLDFGISKLTGEQELHLTVSGVAVGTPFYMPAEQLAGARDIDARVDVYAVGVMLYEGLTHALPHVADNVVGLALSMLHTTPRRPSDYRPELPEALDAVVMRALARERVERYESMDAFIAALSPLASTLSHAAPAPTAHGGATNIAAPSADTEPLAALPAATGSAWSEEGAHRLADLSPAGSAESSVARPTPTSAEGHDGARSARPSAGPSLRLATLWLVVASGVLVLAAGLTALSARHRVANLPPALPVPRARALPTPARSVAAVTHEPTAVPSPRARPAASPSSAEPVDGGVARAPISPAPRAAPAARPPVFATPPAAPPVLLAEPAVPAEPVTPHEPDAAILPALPESMAPPAHDEWTRPASGTGSPPRGGLLRRDEF